MARRLGVCLWLLAMLSAFAQAGKDEVGLKQIGTEQLEDEILEAQCPKCCPVTIRTVRVTLCTTEYRDRTIYTTATEHDTITKTEHDTKTTTEHDTTTTTTCLTQYVTTTAIQTFQTSYPVTVTTTANCVRKTPVASPNQDKQVDKRTHPPEECDTVTITQWVTTTATKSVTGVQTVTKTQTVQVPTVVPTTIDNTKTIEVPTVVPTTVENTKTIDRTKILTDYRTVSATVWVPTTLVETRTFSTEYPVTRTVDSTVIQTNYVTSSTTVVTTIATSYPVVSFVTKPVTEVHTVTAPGQPTTLTLPGTTETRPGPTIITTLTRTLPQQTKTVTENGTPRTITQPGQTVTQTSTTTQQATTVSLPDKTVTVTPIFDVTLCPRPTGASGPLDPKSDLTFGCKPGYVCNPPKPAGCNLFPDLPSDDYLCPPDSCIPAPPYANVTWKDCETSYYPPAYGYFNLNPEAFGLSYDIFEFNVHEETLNGRLTTITTGNWASQTSLSEYPRSHVHARGAPDVLKGCHHHNKREITPAVCFATCGPVVNIALSVGKTDELCKPGSEFRRNYDACTQCIDANSNRAKNVTNSYVAPTFSQFIRFCDGREAIKPSSSSVVEPEPVVSKQPPVKTTSQAEVVSQTFKPVESTQSATKGEGDKPMNPSRSGPLESIVSNSAGAGSTGSSNAVSSAVISVTGQGTTTVSGAETEHTQGSSPSAKEPVETTAASTGAASASGSRRASDGTSIPDSSSGSSSHVQSSSGSSSEAASGASATSASSSGAASSGATSSDAASSGASASGASSSDTVSTEGSSSSSSSKEGQSSSSGAPSTNADGGLASSQTATGTTGQGQGGATGTASATSSTVTGGAGSLVIGAATWLSALMVLLVMI